LFKDMANGAFGNLNLGSAMDLFKTAIITIVVILLVIGVLIRVIVKVNKI